MYSIVYDDATSIHRAMARVICSAVPSLGSIPWALIPVDCVRGPRGRHFSSLHSLLEPSSTPLSRQIGVQVSCVWELFHVVDIYIYYMYTYRESFKQTHKDCPLVLILASFFFFLFIRSFQDTKQIGNGSGHDDQTNPLLLVRLLSSTTPHLFAHRLSPLGHPLDHRGGVIRHGARVSSRTHQA